LANAEPAGAIRYVSPSVEGTLGYGPEEWIGQNVFLLVHPDDASRLKARLEEIPTSGTATVPILFRIRHQNGSWRDFEATGNLLAPDPESQGLVLTFRDVTGRLAAEAAFRESVAR